MMTLTVEYYFTHPQDKLGMYASDPEDNSQEHGHEFAELVIVEEGHGLHVINGRPLYIQQGTYFTSSLAMCIIMMTGDAEAD
ncbi:HTH-type transcriptional activator RhaS [Klebsiella pneumoniae]|uniref:HTH-type transcriptional activator RhaS n=1 Tax=Klebsiella pneumoniae TaxID=573 RepID=A0A378F6B3_KLEPN|nr:HTH-type transcriptional activator RhaS [Klebsiella pneumoniae]